MPPSSRRWPPGWAAPRTSSGSTCRAAVDGLPRRPRAWSATRRWRASRGRPGRAASRSATPRTTRSRPSSCGSSRAPGPAASPASRRAGAGSSARCSTSTARRSRLTSRPTGSRPSRTRRTVIPTFLRNRVRHELLPLLAAQAGLARARRAPPRGPGLARSRGGARRARAAPAGRAPHAGRPWAGVSPWPRFAGLPAGAVKAAVRLALVEVASADRLGAACARRTSTRWPRWRGARTGARVRLPRGRRRRARPGCALGAPAGGAPRARRAPRPGAPSGGGDGRRDGRDGSAPAGSAGRSGLGGLVRRRRARPRTRACPGRPRRPSGSGRAGPGSAWCRSAEPTPCGSRSSWAAAGVPRQARARWPVVAREDEVLWLLGVRRGAAAPLTATTRTMLRLHAAPPRPPGLPDGDTV